MLKNKPINLQEWNIYCRSILFLIICAIKTIDRKANIYPRFTVNNGLFCEISYPQNTSIEKNNERMKEMVSDWIQLGLPIKKLIYKKQKALDVFQILNDTDTVNALSVLKSDAITLYKFNDIYVYLWDEIVDNTAKISQYELDFDNASVLIRTPNEHSNGSVRPKTLQPKFNLLLNESKRWADIMNCRYTFELRNIIYNDKIGELIRIAEALQEKQIAHIADYIQQHQNEVKLVLIAGPSSSGKTSFAQRLRVQLLVNGLIPITISIDDYFKNRLDTPKNKYGDYDYESLEAIDTELFNNDLSSLLTGKSVNKPHYNFITGKKEWRKDDIISLNDKHLIIVEGIHGLNEELTKNISREQKVKIYISALTHLNIDAHNRIPTTDVRLLRRIIRDEKFRGSTAQKTILQWVDVREGEEKYIFPFQEEADILFNSALIYELSVLKKYATPLLNQISPDDTGYIEAKRLLNLLQHVTVLQNDHDIPNNSLLREFIGGSIFFGK